MDKYYTPKIEEFHVGFEFEVNYTNEGWTKEVFCSGEGRNIDSVSKLKAFLGRAKFKEAYRVKYLDKEDIESLGFEFVTDGWWSTNLAGDGYQILWKEGGRLHLSYGQHEFSTVKFDGIIKNKSELKVLLKQLEIHE